MNILEMYDRFPTQESCIAHLEKARWGNGKPVCPYCGSQNTAKAQHRHRCYDCKTSFSVTVGTIFHRTHLPLQKWFFAILLMMNSKKGLSALQLHRDLKVNKNTAWRISMQIRKAVTQANQRDILSGIIEMDETYIGEKLRKGSKGDGPGGQHKHGRGTKKAPVIGAVERGGRVSAQAVHKDKMKGRHLRVFVRQRVKTEASELITDEYKGYLGMGKLLPHSIIKHQEWYVDGDTHTNTIEGFWAMLKREMFGQYHNVSGRRLQRYVDVFCFRYNRRYVFSWNVFDELIGRDLRVVR